MTNHGVEVEPDSVTREREKEIRQPTLAPKERQSRPRLWIRRVLIAGTLGAAAVGLSLWIGPRLSQKPPKDVVVASGRIEGREVTLAPKEIQGRIKTLLVDEGYKVSRGQLLAELESDQLEAKFASLAAGVSALDAQIKQAEIDVTYTQRSTDASFAAAQAAVSSAQAHLARAKAVLADTTVEHQRSLSLYKEQVISRSALDQATMTYETSLADVNASEKDLAQAEANLAVALAAKDTVELKRQQLHTLQENRHAAIAQLAEARANLSERRILAPTDGTILSRPVEVGDVASPGTPIFVMVNMNRLYLKVYIPEPEIPKLKLGDEAEVAVDAFPGRTFAARITKIYEQAEFTPKNVETKEERVKLVFGVELTFLKPEGMLKPGMPADCTIHWKGTAARPGAQ